MLLSEALKRTGLTRKAVEYYIAQGLLSPQADKNSYRIFSEEEVSRLEIIAAYRKLGMNTADIGRILAGNEKQVFSHLLLKQTLNTQREQRKLKLLDALASGATIQELSTQLSMLDAQETIASRLLSAFPGIFGQYFTLHFTHFLQDSLETERQRKAYDKLVAWLDALPPLNLPEDLCVFLEDTAKYMDAQQMDNVHTAILAASANPGAYLNEHADVLHAYMAMKDTEEYKASPAARLMEHMKIFQQQSGYIDEFLPAMEELSPSYSLYRKRLEAANKTFSDALSRKSE